MNCPKCNSELLIDRVDKDGRYFYVCMNRACEEYRKSFNPVSGDITDAEMNTPKIVTEEIKEPEQEEA